MRRVLLTMLTAVSVGACTGSGTSPTAGWAAGSPIPQPVPPPKHPGGPRHMRDRIIGR